MWRYIKALHLGYRGQLHSGPGRPRENQAISRHLSGRRPAAIQQQAEADLGQPLHLAQHADSSASPSSTTLLQELTTRLAVPGFGLPYKDFTQGRRTRDSSRFRTAGATGPIWLQLFFIAWISSKAEQHLIAIQGYLRAFHHRLLG